MLLSLFFALLLLPFLPLASLSENPGFRAAITNKGLSQVCDTATVLLKESLPSLSIPQTINGRANIRISRYARTHINYEVKRIKMRILKIGKCKFVSGADGLTLSSSRISAEVKGRVSANRRFARASTNFKINFKDVSFSVIVKLVHHPKSGDATLTNSDCRSRVDRVSTSFRGSSGWLYRLLKDRIAGELKRKFNSIFCTAVKTLINKQGNAKIKSLPLVIGFKDLAIIDCTLTQDPKYTKNYMVVFMKGQFQAVNKANSIPFSPPKLPPVQVKERMLYVWLTNYMLNTASYVLQQSSSMDYSYKLCISSLFAYFPSMGMQITLISTKPPSINISLDGGQLTAFANIDIDVVFPYNYTVTVFTLGFSTVMDFHAQIHDDEFDSFTITADVSLASTSVTLESSTIGMFDTIYKYGLQYMMNNFVIPKINQYTNEGITIPTIDGLSFIDPQLTFGEGYALLSTDINYKLPAE